MHHKGKFRRLRSSFTLVQAELLCNCSLQLYTCLFNILISDSYSSTVMLRFKCVLFAACCFIIVESKILFDFTAENADLSEWSEQSDVVREPGMSKASFVMQKTKLFKRAVFFTLLNPQPNGAGFAGVRVPVRLNLSNYTAIQIRARGQGANSRYKIILRHKGIDEDPLPSYEQIFHLPLNEFREVSLPLKDFLPYSRGKELDPKEVGYLDTSNITNFEFQMFGGVYSPYNQSGASSLEIDWVKAI